MAGREKGNPPSVASACGVRGVANEFVDEGKEGDAREGVGSSDGSEALKGM